MTAILSEAQAGIVQWLFDNGGECILDRHGGFVAQGERRTISYAASVIRLVASGYIEGAGPNRLRLTDAGRAAATPAGNPVHVIERDWDDYYVRHGLREEDLP